MLWMVRAFPHQINRLEEFLQENIIAVYWGIGDLTGCHSKSDIASVVAEANLQPRDASLKTGLLNRFVNQMKVGDLIIVPYEEMFYTASIQSDYYYDEQSTTFEHQRKVEWLFEGEPLHRSELPEKLQSSIRTQLGLADMSQHHEAFLQFMNSHSENEDGATLEVNQRTTELSLLVPSALAILRDELASSDRDRRLKAAIAVMEMNQKQNN